MQINCNGTPFKLITTFNSIHSNYTCSAHEITLFSRSISLSFPNTLHFTIEIAVMHQICSLLNSYMNFEFVEYVGCHRWCRHFFFVYLFEYFCWYFRYFVRIFIVLLWITNRTPQMNTNKTIIQKIFCLFMSRKEHFRRKKAPIAFIWTV